MNKSEKMVNRIKGLHGGIEGTGKVEEDIGYSGETNGHKHIYQLASGGNGTGTTIGTKTMTLDGQEIDAVNDHVHKIFDFQMSLADDGHSHSLT